MNTAIFIFILNQYLNFVRLNTEFPLLELYIACRLKIKYFI